MSDTKAQMNRELDAIASTEIPAFVPTRTIPRVRAIKITYYDASMATYVNPAQVIYWQVYTTPKAKKLSGMLKEQQAWGEVIAPGGAFFFWREDEAQEAWKLLGVD